MIYLTNKADFIDLRIRSIDFLKAASVTSKYLCGADLRLRLYFQTSKQYAG